MSKKNKIGLALGSGGARGLTHIGVLKAIDEFGIKIDYIAGSSIGALIGAAYSLGMSPADIEKIALQTDWKLIAKILLPSFSLTAFVSDKYLMKFLNLYFADKSFDDCKIPFSAIATDIESGEMVVIDSGSIINAVRSSISIPMLFSPVKFGRHILVDGGISNPIPVNIVKKHDPDFIFGVNLRNQYSIRTHYQNNGKNNGDKKENISINDKIENLIKNPKQLLKKEGSENKSNLRFIPILNQMFVVTQKHLADLIILNTEPDVLIEPDTPEFATLDFHKSQQLIEIGYKSAIAELAKFKEKLNNSR